MSKTDRILFNNAPYVIGIMGRVPFFANLPGPPDKIKRVPMQVGDDWADVDVIFSNDCRLWLLPQVLCYGRDGGARAIEETDNEVRVLAETVGSGGMAEARGHGRGQRGTWSRAGPGTEPVATPETLPVHRGEIAADVLLRSFFDCALCRFDRPDLFGWLSGSASGLARNRRAWARDSLAKPLELNLGPAEGTSFARL